MSHLRRTVGAAGAGLLVSSALAACGSSPADEGQSGQAWSYKSGDDKTYTADSTPTRIIAQGGAAAALISFGIKPVAIYANEPIEDSKSLKDLDLSGVEASSKKVTQLAPVVGPSIRESTSTVLGGFEDLAGTLGVDLDAPDIAAGKKAFDSARDRFEDTVAQIKGLTAMAAEHSAELSDFRDWGLDVLVPSDPDPKFPYWENLSSDAVEKADPGLT